MVSNGQTKKAVLAMCMGHKTHNKFKRKQYETPIYPVLLCLPTALSCISRGVFHRRHCPCQETISIQEGSFIPLSASLCLSLFLSFTTRIHENTFRLLLFCLGDSYFKWTSLIQYPPLHCGCLGTKFQCFSHLTSNSHSNELNGASS